MAAGTITVVVTLAVISLAFSYPRVKDEERIVLRAGPGDLNDAPADDAPHTDEIGMKEISGVFKSQGQTGDSVPKHPTPEKNETWVTLRTNGNTTKFEFSSSASVSNNGTKDGVAFSSSRTHSTGGFILTNEDTDNKPFLAKNLNEKESHNGDEVNSSPNPKNIEEVNHKPSEEHPPPSPNEVEP